MTNVMSYGAESKLRLPSYLVDVTDNEMEYVDAGAWSWKGFFQSIVGGAVGGGIAGAFARTMTLPIIGTVAGWLGEVILGAIGGVTAYLVSGWW